MNINHTRMTLEINSCKNYEILEVRQGDKGSRIIDFAFTVNGETVDLASTMSAKVNATVDDVIVADSVAAVVDTENNVVTVTLTDTMLALSGICKMDIVLMEGNEIITAETVCLRVGKSVINDDSKAFPGASSIVEITKEVENARGGHNSLGARLDTVDTNLTKKANKSDIDSINSRLQSAEQNLHSKANATDVSNVLKNKEDNLNKVSSKTDITDRSTNYPSIKYLNDYYYDANEIYSSEETDELLENKADKATTLAGYGITDAYTQEEGQNSINELKCYLTKLGLQVFESYPYDWMYAIKDIRVTDGSTIAISLVKRTSTRNTIVLYLVENGTLSAAKLYANVDSDITGYATYSNSDKTITMTVNWDEIPYNTDVQFGKNYVLCSEWCYGNTRLNYLLDKAKKEMNLNIENKISSFESTEKADKIVSNVQIVGMNHTDARLLISNFNRHYNGDDTDLLYIYTTDDTGSTANFVKGVRVAKEAGTITVDLSEIVSGAVIRFDYDFSGIADGTRLQGTGTGFLVKKNCYSLESVSKSDFENYEKKIPIDFGFFEKFAVVGDSYSSGEIYVADHSQSKGYTVADYFPKSWGQILARKYGATCINLSVGGLTTRTWLTNSHGLTKMLAEKPQELYLCALGINDEISLGASYLGTIEDITNHESYSDYPDTFYGNYGKIIEQIKSHAPKSKIVLMSMAYLYNATEDSFTAAIKNIANHYNIPFINIKDDAYYAKDSIYKTGQSYNHPTAPLYAGMAKANERLFCQCVVDNYDYFKDFTTGQ